MRLILFLILTFPLIAQGYERDIVVLTSLKNPEKKHLLLSKNFDVKEKTEKKFKSAFEESKINLIFVHEANMEDVNKYLTSPKTLALYWISHSSNKVSSNDSKVSLSSTILDINNNNLKDVFQKINKNVKLISIIGCKAKKLFLNFKQRGYYHEDLKIHAFDKIVDFSNGIKKSLKFTSKTLGTSSYKKHYCYGPKNNRCKREKIKIQIDEQYLNYKPALSDDKKTFSQLEIINTNSDYSAILTLDNNFLGVLKTGAKLQTFDIPNKSNYKIKVVYENQSVLERDFLNPLQINAYNESEILDVSFLKDKNGNPYFKNRNIYYLK